MIGLVFPGQGSQFVGMGKEFYENFKVVKETFEEGSEAIKVDMKKLLFDGPDQDLKLTHNTQPAILLLSVALDRITKPIFQNKNQITAGHSLGEYSALVSIGVLTLSQAIQAVRIRGEWMQKAVPVGQGSMIAVLGTSNENVEKICEWAEKTSGLKPLEPANYNAPGQVVISGSSHICSWLTANYKGSDISNEIKAKFIPLNVSAPFHCSLMKPAQDAMKFVIDDLKLSKPNFPVIQNVTAQETLQTDEIRKNLLAQISAPVKWVQSMERMKALGAQRVIEIGPGKVLTGLVKKIDSEHFQTFNMENIDDFKMLESEF